VFTKATAFGRYFVTRLDALPYEQNVSSGDVTRTIYSCEMQFTDERLEEFRRLYKQAYGEEISVDDARHLAHRLVRLYRLFNQLDQRAAESPPPDQSAGKAF